MAFKLYVGNYPSNFTKKDLENLFHDFHGIEVVKMFSNDSKCFSFLNCKDIGQLISVIKKMNRTKVSGRDLIVRASDKSLQDYVVMILQNEESSSSGKASSPSETPFVSEQVTRNKYRQPYGKSECEKLADMHKKSDANNFQTSFPKSYEDSGIPENKSICSSKFMHNIYQDKQDDTDCVSARDSSLLRKTPNEVNSHSSPRCNNESAKYYAHSSRSHLNSYQTVSDNTFANDSSSLSKILNEASNQSRPSNINQSLENNKYYSKSPFNNYPTLSDENRHEYFKTDSKHSSGSLQKSCHESIEQIKTANIGYSGYSYNTTSNIGSQASENAGYFSQERDSSSATWLSIFNFRIGTSVGTLYELFSDYNPLKVRMICNEARRDKTLTEAYVCFPNRDIADDVILNFDNTMFEGRLIFVTDAEDLTLTRELMILSHS